MMNLNIWYIQQQQFKMATNQEKPKLMVQNISCIIPQTQMLGGLFLGNTYGSQNPQILLQYGIRAVLTTSIQTPLTYNPIDIPYHLKIAAHDKNDYQIIEHLEQCIEFIHKYRQITNVFVHCYAGVSRSATVVIAYIMKLWKWNLKNTMAFVQMKRIVAKPNDGFMGQLKIYEERLFGKMQGQGQTGGQVQAPGQGQTVGQGQAHIVTQGQAGVAKNTMQSGATGLMKQLQTVSHKNGQTMNSARNNIGMMVNNGRLSQPPARQNSMALTHTQSFQTSTQLKKANTYPDPHNSQLTNIPKRHSQIPIPRILSSKGTQRKNQLQSPSQPLYQRYQTSNTSQTVLNKNQHHPSVQYQPNQYGNNSNNKSLTPNRYSNTYNGSNYSSNTQYHHGYSHSTLNTQTSNLATSKNINSNINVALTNNNKGNVNNVSNYANNMGTTANNYNTMYNSNANNTMYNSNANNTMGNTGISNTGLNNMSNSALQNAKSAKVLIRPKDLPGYRG